MGTLVDSEILSNRVLVEMLAEHGSYLAEADAVSLFRGVQVPASTMQSQMPAERHGSRAAYRGCGRGPLVLHHAHFVCGTAVECTNRTGRSMLRRSVVDEDGPPPARRLLATPTAARTRRLVASKR